MGNLRTKLVEIKNTPLLWRIFAFFALFVAISGTLGPLIINHDLVQQFGFGIYGGAGKALIFASIAFGLLVWRSRQKLELPSWNRLSLLWFIPATGAYFIARIAITHLWEHEYQFIWPFLTHAGILMSIIGVSLATISFAGLRKFWQSYRHELLLSIGIGVGYYVFLTLVYRLWEGLATTVMHGTAWLLTLSGLDVNVLPPRYLILDKFSIEISQWCSGIESIALFTGLYAIIGILDRNRFNIRKFAAVFIPALAGIFCFNILRVYSLIMLGYFVNEHLAFVLFHTYAGMVFFVLYSALFWRFSYKWMLKQNH